MKKGLLVSLFAFAFVFVNAVGVSANYDGTDVDPIVSGDQETYKVDATDGDTVTLNDVGSSDGELEVTFDGNVSGSIVVNELATRPAEAPTDPPGAVSIYFDVDLVGLTNDDISSATWRFTVARSTIDASGGTADNIFLYHYNGSAWERLTTRQVSSTDTAVTYEADITSFSPFAVSAVLGLSNTGSQQMTAIVVGVSTIALVIGTFFFSRNKSEA